MRIIAGERRGWKIEPPEGYDVTRPITDRIKENLFNIIQWLVPGSTVLDLFAGVGSMGLECLSRQARWVTFVEQNREVAQVLKRNIAKLRFEEQCRLMTGSALKLRPAVRDTGRREMPEDLVFNLIFVDPPYRMLADELMRATIGEALDNLVQLGAVALDATIIVRREAREKPTDDWAGFRLTRSRTYGSMALDFLERADRPQEEPPADASQSERSITQQAETRPPPDETASS